MEWGSLPDWLVVCGTFALAASTVLSTRRSARLAERGIEYDKSIRREEDARRQQDEQRRQDDEACAVAVRVDGIASPRAIKLTWPGSYFIGRLVCCELDGIGLEALTVRREGPGSAMAAWPERRVPGFQWWLWLFTDPYGTRRAIYGDTKGALYSGRADPDKDELDVAGEIRIRLQRGPER